MDIIFGVVGLLVGGAATHILHRWRINRRIKPVVHSLLLQGQGSNALSKRTKIHAHELLRRL